MYKGKVRDPFYGTVRWQRARAAALRRDLYLCQDCRAAGRMVAAEMVHHIVPLEVDRSRATDLGNLVSLCDACHNRRHPEKHERPPGARLEAESPLLKNVTIYKV